MSLTGLSDAEIVGIRDGLLSVDPELCAAAAAAIAAKAGLAAAAICIANAGFVAASNWPKRFVGLPTKTMRSN